MVVPQVFFSDNETNTPADALKAIGLAEVLRAWLERLGRDDLRVTITDRGGYYEIRLPSALEQEHVEQVRGPFAVGRGKKLGRKPAEKRKAQANGAIKSVEGFFYDEERTKADTYFKHLSKLSALDRQRFRAHPEEFPDIQAPDPDLNLYSCLSHFKVADAYNALCQQWEGQDTATFQANLTLVLETFCQHPNVLPAQKGQLSGKAHVTLLQVINPACGKGGNAPKASGLSIGNLSGFWLIEYLKFVGFFTIAAPVMVKKSKDRKTYVLHPVKLELSAIREVMRAFRQTFYGSTAVKSDLLAALQFSRELVNYLFQQGEARGKAGDVAHFDSQPTVTDIGRGFDVAFYKDMGSAYATMNLSTINLPGWLGPLTAGAAKSVLAVLKEHIAIVRSIRSAKEDEGSEELELLRRYRDFLSGHDVERFFDFAARYGDYYLAKRHRNQWATQFTTEGMNTLMEHTRAKLPFSRILENEGFQAIAAAIRQATVIAQRRAATGEQGYPFEVRYGLGQQLLRAAAYPEEFLAALSEFLHAYNAENARIAERVAKGTLPNVARNRRAAVQTEHIKQIVRLIDEYNSSDLICKMLVAYGYARDPYTPEDKTGAPAELAGEEESPIEQGS